MSRWIGLTAGLAIVAAPAGAQLNSLPVFVSPKGGTGFTVAVDYGRGLNTESGENTTLAARASLGLGPFAIGGGIASANPRVGTLGRKTEVQYMGNASLRILGGALVPVAVNLHAGVGVLNRDVATGVERREITVPFGLGLGLSLPTPGFAFEPWVAPRYTIRVIDQGAATETQNGFGASAGIRLGFANGLSLEAAFDWTDLSSATLVGALTNPNVPSTQPAVFGLGLSYTFRLPGIGVPGPGL